MALLLFAVGFGLMRPMRYAWSQTHERAACLTLVAAVRRRRRAAGMMTLRRRLQAAVAGWVLTGSPWVARLSAKQQQGGSSVAVNASA